MTFYCLRPIGSPVEWDHDMMRFMPRSFKCPINSSHDTSPCKRVPSQLHVKPPSRVLRDFIWTWYNECLVTDKVLTLFNSDGVTGFRPRRVAVTGVKRGLPAIPLYELVITGWGGQADKQSGITLRSRCEGCGRETYDSILDPARLVNSKTWDGSDLFTVWPLPRFIFATARIKDIIHNHALRGVRVVPLDELSLSSNEYTPGSLRQWYPDRVAKKRKKDFWL